MMIMMTTIMLNLKAKIMSFKMMPRTIRGSSPQSWSFAICKVLCGHLAMRVQVQHVPPDIVIVLHLATGEEGHFEGDVRDLWAVHPMQQAARAVQGHPLDHHGLAAIGLLRTRF